MKWIVGLDLRAPSLGAIRFAAWMKRNATTVPTVQGVHVVAEARYGYSMALTLRSAQQIEKLAKMSAEVALQHAEATDAFDGLVAHTAPSVEDGLAAALTASAAEGLIIGRLATKHARLGPRLGPEARRMLRHLPAPVMVVPPELAEHEIGTGPVLLATDMTAASHTAGQFAMRLAAELGRELHVLHVAMPLEDYGPMYLPEPLMPGVAAAYEASCRDALHAWGTKLGVEHGKGEVAFGDPVDEVLQIGRRTNALAVVCGSRGLSMAQRIFGHSIASDLAAHADRPVVVVPSPPETQEHAKP